MKLYLLIAGDGYYPQSGTDDWKGCFSSWEEANSKVEKKRFEIKTRKKIHEYFKYVIDQREYDWFDIVDLKEWIQ